MTSRRAFLKSGGIALFGIGLGGLPTFVTQAASLIEAPSLFKRRKTLICIFQRGAMDGLAAVTPFNDAYLKAARPTIMMQASKSLGANSLIDLDITSLSPKENAPLL